MTKLLQCLRDELVRRDYAAPTIRSYVQIVGADRDAQSRCYHPASLGVATGDMAAEQPPLAAQTLAGLLQESLAGRSNLCRHETFLRKARRSWSRC